MILLDTHAVIWLHMGHRRGRALQRVRGNLYVSPATVLELHVLAELGKLKVRQGIRVHRIIDDERWLLDDPPAVSWFDRALDLAWTRDPFDRLLVAHARLRRWQLATADQRILENLEPRAKLEL